MIKILILLIPILTFSFDEKTSNTYVIIKKMCKFNTIKKIKNGYSCGIVNFKFDNFETLTVNYDSQEYHQIYHDRYSFEKSHSREIRKKLERIYNHEQSVDKNIDSIIR